MYFVPPMLPVKLISAPFSLDQTKSKISQIQDAQSQVSDLISQYDSAISSGDLSTISELSQRTITPTLSEQEYSRLTNTVSSSYFWSLTVLRIPSYKYRDIILQAGSSPMSSVSAFSLGGGAEPFEEFKVSFFVACVSSREYIDVFSSGRRPVQKQGSLHERIRQWCSHDSRNRWSLQIRFLTHFHFVRQEILMTKG